MPWNPEHYKQIGMTTLDIKNLTTKEMVELIGKLENQIVNLRERIAGLEKDFTYLYKHHVEKNDG